MAVRLSKLFNHPFLVVYVSIRAWLCFKIGYEGDPTSDCIVIYMCVSVQLVQALVRHVFT